jgi:thiamine biosynthesis lipoprotein
MGMPVTVEVADSQDQALLEQVFAYFVAVDEQFSTYKSTSEITKINEGLSRDKWSPEMRLVFDLCEQTRRDTNGYFDIAHNGRLDPSGLVKGWAIHNAANLLQGLGVRNFYVDAGGDVEVSGLDSTGKPWQIGVRNPFDASEIVKVIQLHGTGGVATSGAYVRGDHIYNPLDATRTPKEVKSITVVGPDIYEADRFATAAFAMDHEGIGLIEKTPGLEAYMIDSRKIATFTTGFGKFVVAHA